MVMVTCIIYFGEKIDYLLYQYFFGYVRLQYFLSFLDVQNKDPFFKSFHITIARRTVVC